MANKKVSQLTSKPSVLVTDLFPIADPSTGQLYKTTISDLGTAIGSGVSSVNTLVGAVVLDTDDIQELVSPTNKWFTDTRARAALSASSPLAYNSGTGVFSIPAATGSQNGYLTSTDWTTFNGKLDPSTAASTYLPLTGGTLSGILRVDSALRIKSGSANGILLETYSANELRIRVTPTSTTFDMSLVFPSVSRTYTYPNATGTIALTSDLSAYALDSAVVHNTGNETIAGQKTFSSTLYGASAVFSSALNAQSINITGITASPSVYITTNGTNHAVSIVQSGSGYAIYASGNVAVIGTGYFSSSLTAASLSSTAGYNFTLPSASGTLALTSNLSSYLPLSGGTLTGALSGTSAKFAGRIFTTSDAAYGDLVSTNGCLVFSFDATGQEAYLRSYNYTTSLGKPMNFNASKYVFNEGNVGIGTTAPNGGLTIVAPSSSTALSLWGRAGDNFSAIRFQSNTGATTYSTIYTNASDLHFENGGTLRMLINGSGYLKASNSGAYLSSSAAYHELYNSASNSWNTIMTSTATTADALQIRLNSDSTGFTYLAGYSSSAAAYRVLIYSNGNIQNTNNSYGALSDIKLKENVTDATSKLSDLLKVKVRNYNLIGSSNKQIGVIAQELEEVFPGLIEENFDRDENGNVLTTKTKGVKYSVFVPMLIKAVQELSDKITTLENK